MIELICIILFAIGISILFIRMFKKTKIKNTKKNETLSTYLNKILEEAEQTNDIVLLRQIYCDLFRFKKIKNNAKFYDEAEKIFKFVKNKIASLTNQTPLTNCK